MTYDQAEETYIGRIDEPIGRIYADTVGKFQEGFLAEVTDDLDDAFTRAVDAAERLVEVMYIKVNK